MENLFIILRLVGQYKLGRKQDAAAGPARPRNPIPKRIQNVNLSEK